MKKWSDALVSVDANILKAIEVIDKGAFGIALVIDSQEILRGVITDGDVRRAILKSTPLSSCVKEIMNKNPIYALQGEAKHKLADLMNKKSIKHIPLVDNNHRVVGLEIFENSVEVTKKENIVLIMAGGLGTRLRPLTNNCPKPLLKIDNKPVLQIIMEGLRDAGFYRFYLSLNYRGQMIRDYFGDGSALGVNIFYLEETQPLGTAGALSLLPNIPEYPFIVMNGDIMTTINYQHLLDFHLQSHGHATVCVREYQQTVPYGVVRIDENRLLALEEKPMQHYFINAGIYMLDPDVLRFIPKHAPLNMPDLLTNLIEQRMKLSVFPVREYWSDIGRLEDFEKAHQDYQVHFA